MNKDPCIVPEEDPLTILCSKFDLFMANNGRYTNHTRHISRGVNYIKNGKNCKMNTIDWCEGDLQLEDIANKNVGENYLNPKMKYIIVRLDNRDRTLLQEG